MKQVSIDETVLNGWVKRLLQVSKQNHMPIDLAGRILDVVEEMVDSNLAASNGEIVAKNNPYDHGVVVKGIPQNMPAPAANQILIVRTNQTRWASLMVDEVIFADPETMSQVIENLDDILERS